MKRADLKALGLEEEVIDKVMGLHGQGLESLKNDKAVLASQVDSYKKDNENIKSELEDVKKSLGDDEAKQQKIQDLQASIDKAEAEKLDIKKEYEIKLALADQLHDPDDALVYLSKEDIKLTDDGKIEGLDDKVKTLREKKPYIFKTSEVDTVPADDAEGVTADDNTSTKVEETKLGYNAGSGKGNSGKEVTGAELGKSLAAEIFNKKED